MLEKLRKLDIFGQPFSFNAYKNSGTYTTVCGGLITIFWLILISFVSFVVIREYLDTTKPVISVNRVRLEKPSRLNRSSTYSTVYMFNSKTKSL